jgi:hypothetical protein
VRLLKFPGRSRNPSAPPAAPQASVG